MSLHGNLPYLVLAGVLLFLWGTYVLVPPFSSWSDAQTPAEYTNTHVHGDLLIVVDGISIDLTQERYQSKAENVLHEDIHLHDNEGDIIHRHDADVTLFEFFESIGFSLTPTCLTLDTGASYCTDDDTVLHAYVNGNQYSDIGQYIVNDEDRILIYYGKDDQAQIRNYMDAVSDRACIYSGTCPERGTPPPESCGLTCNI